MPVNGYRWFRGFNDYDNWQASGVSGQGARSFYYPAEAADVRRLPHAARRVERSGGQERQGAIAPVSRREHRAAVRQPRPVQLKAVQDFLRDGQISVDVFGITRGAEPPAAETADGDAPPSRDLSSTFAVGEESAQFGAAGRRSLRPPAEVLAPLDKIPVDGPTRRIGPRRGRRPHAQGRALLSGRHRRRVRRVGRARSGRRQGPRAAAQRRRWLTKASGPVDPGAHFYRSLQLDEHGNPINKRNAWMTRSVAYVRLIPPGAADTVHYRLEIPADAGDRIVSAGEGQLPQVRVVEHAVGVCRRARSAAASNAARHAVVRRRPRGCSPATRSKCPAQIKAIPDISDDGDGAGGSVAAVSSTRTRRCRT